MSDNSALIRAPKHPTILGFGHSALSDVESQLDGHAAAMLATQAMFAQAMIAGVAPIIRDLSPKSEFQFSCDTGSVRLCIMVKKGPSLAQDLLATTRTVGQCVASGTLFSRLGNGIGKMLQD